MKTPTKQTAHRLAAVLAIATAFAATGAWAASRYWTGADDTIWDNTGNWEEGNFPGNDEVCFQNNKFDSKFTGESGSVITFTNSFSVWRTRLSGAGSEQAPLVLRAADLESGLDFGSSVGIIVADSSGSGYLRIESGTYPISAGIRIGENATYQGGLTVTGGAVLKAKNGNMDIQNGKVVLDNGTIEISKTDKYVSLGNQANGCELHLENGGVLTTSLISDGDKGKTSTVLFNGGTLKANGALPAIIADKANITVNVGANGGTIDASGFNIQVPRPIAPSGANDGGMTFKGRGSVSLKYANTYTGATKVELGTKIIAMTADAKNSVLANLVVTGVAADDDYTVFEYGDGLSSADLANVSCPDGAEGTTISLGAGNTSIVVHYVAPPEDLAWNGGDGAWADANAWTNATGTAKTWSDGNYAVFDTDDTVTLGVDAAALSATFNANATVAVGGGTLTVPVVDVGSGVSATIAAPTAGVLEKTGAGTLTLGSSRAGTTTTLTEGTLVANAPVGTLTLGTDAAKPVTFDYEGQTYSTSFKHDNGCDVTLTNCTFSSFAGVANGTVLVAKGATAWVNGWLTTGPGSELTDTAAVLDICGGVVSNVTKNVSLGDHGELGATSVVRVRNGGLFTTGNGIVVGARAAATLTIDDGSVIVPYEVQFCQTSDCKANEACFLNLNAGGLLTARSITYGSGAANATFTFNGGTLKANQDYTLIANKPNMSVVTATSGTIDADGHVVTIAKAISGEGGMTYQGGGVVTLSGAINYTGGTTVEAGTVVVVPDVAKRTALGAITVTGLENNICEVVRLSGEGTFSADDLPENTETVTFSVSPDGKSIFAASGMSGTFWIGGSGDLSTKANWSDGVVPTENPTIKWASPITLTNSGGFAPKTLTIPDDSAVVTLAGALTVNCLTNASKLAVASTGSLTVTGDLVAMVETYGGSRTFLHSNEGTVTVGGKAIGYTEVSGYPNYPNVYEYAAVTENTRPIQARGIAYQCGSNGQLEMKLQSSGNTAGSWVVGADGFSFPNARNAYYSTFCAESTAVTLYSADNWTLANSGKYHTTRGDLYVSDASGSSLAIDTSDYVTPATPRTVTLKGRIVAHNPVTIKGCGTLVVDTTGSSTDETVPEDFRHTCLTNAATLYVTDTATLKISDGKKITGNGTVSLAAGTTLLVPDASATVTLPSVTPVAGSTIVVTNLTAGTPAIALSGSLTVPTEGKVTLKIGGSTQLENGIYTVVSSANALPSDTVDHLTLDASEVVSGDCSLCAKGCALLLLVGISEPGYGIWVGGTDANLSTAANWLNDEVPRAGDTLNFTTAGTATTINADYGNTRVFATAVFGSGVVTLTGSLCVNTLTNAYTLAVASGASLTVDGDIVVCDGKGTLLYSNEGTVTIGRAVCTTADGGIATTTKQYEVVTANTQPIRTGGFLFDRVDDHLYWRLESNRAGPGAWVVGASGLAYGNVVNEKQMRYYAQNSPVTLYSSANWTLEGCGQMNATMGELNVFADSSLTIDTSDYGDPTIARIVTLEGRILAEGPVTVKGCGTLVVNTTGAHAQLPADLQHTCLSNATLSVTESATLKINEGRKITGNGTISLAAGTTLALDSSALGTIGDTEFTPCIPGLALPETGTATLRIDGTRLRSGNYVLLNAVPANYANLAVDCTTAAIADRKASVVEKNGQLVLNIPPTGLMVIFM